MQTVKNINAEQFKEAVFFSLSLHRWPNRATERNSAKIKAYFEELNAPETEGEAQKATNGTPAQVETQGKGSSRAKVTKILVISEPLDALNGYMAEVKARICGPYGLCNPSKIKEGLFVASKALIQTIEDELAKAQEQIAVKYLPAVLADYKAAIERAETRPVKKGGLGPIFNSTDYPTPARLAEMFSVDWQWLALGVPDDLPAQLRAAAAEKLEKQFTEAATEVKAALREGFAGLIEHALERLTPPAPGEKPKVFRDTLIDNIRAFVSVFDARNIMRDNDLANLVAKAKTVIESGVTAQKIRDYASVKERTRAAFTEIKSAVDGMLTERAERVFSFDEQEVAA